MGKQVPECLDVSFFTVCGEFKGCPMGSLHFSVFVFFSPNFWVGRFLFTGFLVEGPNILGEIKFLAVFFDAV